MARYQASEREARYRGARDWGLPPVVSEGDSWFSYELYLNVIDRIDDTKRLALKRLESSGDTLQTMVGYSNAATGIRALKNVVQQERPIFLFFSGGGNDIVGSELKGSILPFHPLRKPENYLDTPGWNTLLENIRVAYPVRVDEIGPLCPIFAHGYDYFVPSNRPVKICPGVPGRGPWVWPEMTLNIINITDPELQRAIGRAMIDEFNDRILAPPEIANSGYFAHVNLRGTVAPTTDWQNEIHPTSKGFEKLAKRFLSTVDKKLPGIRIARAERLGGTIVITRNLVSLLVLMSSLVGSTHAGGQESARPNAGSLFGDPRFFHLDSARVELASARHWRGLYLGKLPMSSQLNVALWRIDGEKDRRALVASALASLPLLERKKRENTDLGELRTGYRLRLDTEDGEFGVGGSIHAFNDRYLTELSSEFDVAVQRRVNVPGTELRPLLRLNVAHDFERFDATYVEPSVMIDSGISQNNNASSIGGRFIVSTSWSDYPGSNGSSSDFGYHATSASAWVVKDWSVSPIGPVLPKSGSRSGGRSREVQHTGTTCEYESSSGEHR